MYCDVFFSDRFTKNPSIGSELRRILKPGLDDGLWTMDGRRWTMDDGPFHGHAINNFVTSRIEHTPYETFLAVYLLLSIYFIHLQDTCHIGLA